MMTKTPLSKYDDIIDSRDIIERIEEFEAEQEGQQECVAQLFRDLDEDFAADITAGRSDPGQCLLCVSDLPEEDREDATVSIQEWREWEENEGAELDTLRELAAEAEGSSDWQYGETLIRDTYFKDYAQELAEDCGLEQSNSWPQRCIDWDQAADELQMDYFSVEFDGITYWIRA